LATVDVGGGAMTRKAVVTGGAGFIGSTLVDLLVDRDWDVLVVDSLRTGSMENLRAARRRGKVAVHVMDVRAPELAEAMERYRPEVVFHLAAQTKVPFSVGDPVGDADVNVLGTINVLEAARAAGTRRVVFASSGGAVYGRRAKLPVAERSARHPESPYGISKKVVEDYFRWYEETYGLEYVLIGPANVYGPRQDPGLEGGVVAIRAAVLRSSVTGARPGTSSTSRTSATPSTGPPTPAAGSSSTWEAGRRRRFWSSTMPWRPSSGSIVARSSPSRGGATCPVLCSMPPGPARCWAGRHGRRSTRDWLPPSPGTGIGEPQSSRSSRLRGKSCLRKRLSDRSASMRPPVWQPGQ
jgi:UDP-glucose 4-epimerase